LVRDIILHIGAEGRGGGSWVEWGMGARVSGVNTYLRMDILSGFLDETPTHVRKVTPTDSMGISYMNMVPNMVPPGGAIPRSIPIPTPQYLIVPSSVSTMGSVITVVALYLLYMVFIGYLASYHLKFYPNMYMFWNFLTSGNNVAYQNEFENYVRSVTTDVLAQTVVTDQGVGEPTPAPASEPETFTGTGRLEGEPVGSWRPAWWDEGGRRLHMWWNQLLLRTLVRGKTLKVTRVT